MKKKSSSLYNDQKVKKIRQPRIKFRKSDSNTNSTVEVDIVNTENKILQIMMEDETLWINSLVENSGLSVEHFFEELSDGVLLCRLGNVIERFFIDNSPKKKSTLDFSHNKPSENIIQFTKPPKTLNEINKFLYRDNVHKFLQWCRSHK